MPKPRSLLLHLLLIASCIANAAGADDAPSQEPTTPSSSFQGEWQLLHASIGVSAMHMQLLPGDFILMFDRTDTGPSNISLAALAPCAATADGADRTAQSCSSGALLPNGTLLQTGGFSNGDRIARLISPATGWVELPSFLAARRWYATDMILPDGHVLILGGRRQSNLEYFPHADDVAPAQALTFFPFMDETTEPDAENILYPFGRSSTSYLTALSVFANDRAVDFDPYNRVLRSDGSQPSHAACRGTTRHVAHIRLCPDAHMSFLVWPYDFLEQMDENLKSITF
ncbi:putative aldehyde oxidase Art an 7 [Miscanthus floridulus]|uniref:putative aldehyde oxidase Art an 7 n=1 Tax=Miscanthus floridulus TaxID=154761 RepID=UPI00345891D1